MNLPKNLTWIPIKNSKLIDKVAYEILTKSLFISFVKLDKSIVYSPVPKEIYAKFISSPSPGQFFNKELDGKYTYKTLTENKQITNKQ